MKMEQNKGKFEFRSPGTWRPVVCR